MTPPIEELSSNSSSSETSLAAVRSLRKILGNQAQADQAKAGQEGEQRFLESYTESYFQYDSIRIYVVFKELSSPSNFDYPKVC
jgi:hypothetical protein